MNFSLSNYFAKKHPNEKNLADTKGYKWSGIIIRSLQLMLIFSSGISFLSTILYYSFAEWHFKGTYIDSLIGNSIWIEFGLVFLLLFYYGSRIIIWLCIKEQEITAKIMQYIIDRYVKNYYKKNKSDPPIFRKLNDVQEKGTKWMSNRKKWVRKLITISIPLAFFLAQIVPRLQIIYPTIQQSMIVNSTQVLGTIKSPFT